MKTHARVVVIGGGVVGVSTLYHLALKGWSDAVLLERAELTAGSTWHAAGLLPLFNMSYTVGQLHKYSVDLYKRLPAETGQDVSFHVTGNLRLATCRDRMDEYQKYCGTANTIGVPFQIIPPKRVKEVWPLCEIEGIIGALYHPQDGQGRHRLRACGERDRKLGAPDRQHGGARSSGHRGRAPVSRDRRNPGADRAQETESARARGAARKRPVLLHARGT